MPIPSEKESRISLLWRAREVGAEEQLLKIFRRYDELLKNSKTEEERLAIATMGAAEVYKFFGSDNGLTINGRVILWHDPIYDKKKQE